MKGFLARFWIGFLPKEVLVALNLSTSLRHAMVALALFGLPLFAQQQQQSPGQSTGDPVADAARKAREQKKKEADKPKKVYTDDDLNHYVPATPSSEQKTGAAEGKPSSKEGEAKNGAPAEPDKNAEQQWRKRFREAYGKLAQLEKELDIMQREENKAQVQYYSDPQKAMEEQYTRKEINDKNTKIAAKKDEITQQKQHISDMEDDLRKSGGDPGWARP
jgi:chromosome segregation ATPase